MEPGVVYVRVGNSRLNVAEAERQLGVHGGGITQRVRDRRETHQQAADHFAKRLAALELRA